MSHFNPAEKTAAGVKPPVSVASHLAATQATYRFLNNDEVTVKKLMQPILEVANEELSKAVSSHTLVALDWCGLHVKDHQFRDDLVKLANDHDWGYDILTALAISDKDGSPIAPLCFELRDSSGIHSTRTDELVTQETKLDGLTPVMEHIQNQNIPKPPVFVIDREASSVGHYRDWDAKELKFLVRSRTSRLVKHNGEEIKLSEVVDNIKLRHIGVIEHKGKRVNQLAGETTVTLHRPARTHRRQEDGVRRHVNIAGKPIELRLVVAELRDDDNKQIGHWTLLSNVDEDVDMSTLVRWYYWRWKIENFFKLMKSAGHEMENWLQQSGRAIAKRMLIAAMSTTIVWRLARDETPEADHMRKELVKLSGRQMKRGKGQRGFTEPALLAGLGVMFKMIDYLRTADLEKLLRAAESVMPGILRNLRPDN